MNECRQRDWKEEAEENGGEIKERRKKERKEGSRDGRMNGSKKKMKIEERGKHL